MKSRQMEMFLLLDEMLMKLQVYKNSATQRKRIRTQWSQNTDSTLRIEENERGYEYSKGYPGKQSRGNPWAKPKG